MRQHTSRNFTGPIRGTQAWWRGLDPQTESTEPEEPQPKARKRTSIPEDPRIRKDLVERVRREIEAGTYDTPEKWEIALDRLLDRLGEE